MQRLMKMDRFVDVIKEDIELRCQCSRLLLKKFKKGLEVKCPRCKRIHVFTLAQLTAFLEASNFCALYNSSSEARDSESNAHELS